VEQETQLSLTNRATRLEVSQGKDMWYYSVCQYGFLLVCYSSSSLRRAVFEISDFKNAVTLKIGVGVREGH